MSVYSAQILSIPYVHTEKNRTRYLGRCDRRQFDWLWCQTAAKCKALIVGKNECWADSGESAEIRRCCQWTYRAISGAAWCVMASPHHHESAAAAAAVVLVDWCQ